MEASRIRKLRFAALQIVGAVAVIHLVVGGQSLLRIATRGLLGTYLTQHLGANPRPFLFVLSALAVIAGIVTVARGRLDYRLAYRLGVLVLLGYVVGWLGWHTVLDHGFALRGGSPTTTPHTHDGLVGVLKSHYLEPLGEAFAASSRGTPGTGRTLLGIVSVTLELLGAALLVVLLRVDPRARREDDRNPFDRSRLERSAEESDTDAD